MPEKKSKRSAQKLPREVKRVLRMRAEEVAACPASLEVLRACTVREARVARRLREVENITRERAAARALKSSRLRTNRPAEAVRRVAEQVRAAGPAGLDEPGELAHGWLEEVAVELQRIGGKARRFERAVALYSLLAERSTLLEVRRRDLRRALSYCLHSTQWWIRPLEGWRPKRRDADSQLGELLRYLFAEWPVPAFLDTAWTLGHVAGQRWFRHVGLGRSIRSAPRLPLELSRRASGWFVRAPDGLTPDGAVRYAQVRAFGADSAQGLAIAGSRLRHDFTRGEFWQTVIHWLLAHGEVPVSEYGPIIDWIHATRHEIAHGAEAPVHPSLTMRGRRPERVLEEVRAWHARLAKARLGIGLEWDHAHDIADWRHAEGEGRSRTVFEVQQLLDHRELAREGRLMRHCVEAYSVDCHAGRSTIWSFRKHGALDPDPVRQLTLELNGRRLVQARGRWNKAPTDEAWRLLRLWCRERELIIDRCVRW